MLGDCYAAAVVEHLSKKELMALDAAAYQVKKLNTSYKNCANIYTQYTKLLFLNR